jgi:hypothetical protein
MESGQSLTDISKPIAERIENEIGTALNGLYRDKQIDRKHGGRDHLWREPPL